MLIMMIIVIAPMIMTTVAIGEMLSLIITSKGRPPASTLACLPCAMRELQQQHGFKPSEPTGTRAAKNVGKSTGKSSNERLQIAPLYRGPATGATWSGRGTEPAWIKGRDRQAFKVAG